MYINQMSDQEVIARTAWAEARGEGRDGMQAVINSLQNRVASGIHWWGSSLKSCALCPYQYSCWNSTDPNRPKLLSVNASDPQYAIALDLAAAALGGSLPDIVQHADSYFADTLSERPKWAEELEPVAQIGHHLFYRTAHLSVPPNWG